MWRKGKILGKGGSTMVYLVAVVSPTSIDLLPSLMVVKSVSFYKSHCLAKEVSAKIADFGLAKWAGKKLKGKENKPRLRGTAMYMAPKLILHEEYEPHADIWAIGCTVLQMLTGKEPWKHDKGAEVATILFRIGFSKKVPEIPSGLSKEAEDFLKKCLVRDSKSQ
ncbi:Mitogen-activated protein kinase kinase kinase 18 [Camellia lanceoleosa]|uniref:Mitogen-activated protein kinase kinase kinase 18 n=1 Tax=Camellia lanceoleosa TaxID=1840588 RepID=A0ACC0G542_9ERIC|nr:Mitogen-activated protein kinase kinase kinase 18 [Camellia lanceoleosa]